MCLCVCQGAGTGGISTGFVCVLLLKADEITGLLYLMYNLCHIVSERLSDFHYLIKCSIFSQSNQWTRAAFWQRLCYWAGMFIVSPTAKDNPARWLTNAHTGGPFSSSSCFGSWERLTYSSKRWLFILYSVTSSVKTCPSNWKMRL